MKKNIKFVPCILLSIILNTTMSSQEGWVWQNPLPQGNNLGSVYFVNNNSGWAVGSCGTILHTNDSGINWTMQNNEFDNHLREVVFIDENSGWAVGYDGIILHTSDGGTHWNLQNSGTSFTLDFVCFPSAEVGYVVGIFGIF